MNNFNEESKREIITEIEEDFKNAIKGIVRLPKIQSLQYTLLTDIILNY